MKKKVLLFAIAMLAIVTGARAQYDVTWDEDFINQISLSITYGYIGYIEGVEKSFENNSANGITLELDNYSGQEGSFFMRNGYLNLSEIFDFTAQCQLMIISEMELTGVEFYCKEKGTRDTYGTTWEPCSYVKTIDKSESPTTVIAVNSFGYYKISKIVFHVVTGSPHHHDYSGPLGFDEEYHWHVCTSEEGYCDAPIADKALHVYDANGICTVCGYEATFSISEVPAYWQVNGAETYTGDVMLKAGTKVTVTPVGVPAGKTIKSIKLVPVE